MNAPDLRPTLTKGAQVTSLPAGGWRFTIPAGPAGKYRVAQLDDYSPLPRKRFPWRPPLRIELRARVSDDDLPGTWGFGLWNNPFGMAIFTGVETLRLPTLPDTAWFFYGSPQNYLSLRNDLPAYGLTAMTYQSPRWPALLAPAAIGAPLALLPPGMRFARWIGSRVVRQEAVEVSGPGTDWRSYSFEWNSGGTRYRIDDQLVMETTLSPRGPLGLVIWIDNQFAALPPSGRIKFGTEANPREAWLEVSELKISPTKG